MNTVYIVIWKYRGMEREHEVIFNTETEMREYLHIICTNSKKEIVEFYPLELVK